MQNTLKEKSTEEKQTLNPKKGNKVASTMVDFIGGEFLSKEKNVKHLPFIFFLCFIAICYIANGYYADDQIRTANRLANEIKELRTQYIVVKDSLVIKSKQTEVAAALALQHTGIVESIVPPQKILVKSSNSILLKE